MKKSSVAVGRKVPDFTLPSSSGEDFRLSDFKGKKIVLYFYPKDSTAGCTIEGDQFNALLPKFKKSGAVVFGISRDSLKSHGNFIKKQNYRFDLLSDADEEACEIFDVIKEKMMYGKKVVGIERSTFLIDEDGILSFEWRKVKADGHAEIVLKQVQA